ncbi:hypothetical protein [Acetobacter sp.]|uniref:hypothetical protein n=1 Tax=Acetobacter sp. TaxID=440 RepID=UPI0039E94849
MNERTVSRALVEHRAFKTEAIARAWVMAGLVSVSGGGKEALLTDPDAVWDEDIVAIDIDKKADKPTPFRRSLIVQTRAMREALNSISLRPTPAMEKFVEGAILPQDISADDPGWIVAPQSPAQSAGSTADAQPVSEPATGPAARPPDAGTPS